MSTNKNEPTLLIGAHTSIQGGVHKALLQGEEIGATTIQLFTTNQRQWRAKPIPEAEIALFKQTQEETGLKSLMSHGSYLVNLGSPNSETYSKSLKTFREEIVRCQALGLTYLNFHPGAALDSPREACLEKIVHSLLSVQDLLAKGNLRLLIETTAGQGSTVGADLAEIGYLIQHTAGKIPVGVCIDTCHIFAAGYDIRTPKGWQSTLDTFNTTVGIKHLYALHLNDSMKPLASKRDRHAPLGKGEIGIESFKYLMKDSRTAKLPKYLETPGGHLAWKKEIALIKSWVT